MAPMVVVLVVVEGVEALVVARALPVVARAARYNHHSEEGWDWESGEQ